MDKQKLQLYWKKNIGIKIKLLVIWAIVSYFFGIFFVDQLNTIKIGGFPLGFWFAQQGSIYVFVALIFTYFVLMDRFDKEFDVDEK